MNIFDKLIELFQKFKSHDYFGANQIIKTLYNIHKLALDDISIDRLFGELILYLTLCKNFTLANYDYVISYGEKLSSHLLSATLNNIGAKSIPVDASLAIVTDSCFGNGRVILDRTSVKAISSLSPLLSQNIIPVITGFFGATKDGQIVTLGRGGSDYSATILANALDANEVILWKEVDGIFSGDPNKDPSVKFYSKLSYDEALALAQAGAKILHPEAMIPVQAKNIIVRVKNTFNPDHPGTQIWK